MKTLKNVMQTKESVGEYFAPKVKVMKIKSRKVICGSQQMGEEKDTSTSVWS